MSRDLKPIASKRCYACIQWEGTRTYEREKQLMRVDEGSLGNCLVKHAKTKGSFYCDQFFQLR